MNDRDTASARLYALDPQRDTRAGDGRLFFAAPERNKEPILAVLSELIAPHARVLEIASGSGQHAMHFARHMPGVRWQPTDTSDEALVSVTAWRRHEGLRNVAAPVHLDVLAVPWPIGAFDVVYCANMVHIAPWDCCEALFSGAAGVFPAMGGSVILYGPFARHGTHTAPSNATFHDSLRARNPAWGVRDLDLEVTPVARRHGFDPPTVYPMPANNLVAAFRLPAREETAG